MLGVDYSEFKKKKIEKYQRGTGGEATTKTRRRKRDYSGKSRRTL